MQDITDPLAWLQDAASPRTRQWLADENARADDFLRQTEALRQQLFEEIHARYQSADLSVPTPSGQWLYYFQKQPGQAFSNYYRCPRPANGSLDIDPLQQHLLLAPDALANEGQIAFGAVSPSPDHRYLAYSVLIGQQPGLYVQNLDTPQTLPLRLPIEGFDGSLAWANDSQTLLCAQTNERHSHRLLRYRLGDAEASVVFEETDDRFDLSCTRSRSGQWLLLHSIGPGISEVWVAAADDAQRPFNCLISRTEQRRARLDHGHWNAEPHWFCLSAQAQAPAQLLRLPSSPQATASAWQVMATAGPQQAIERMVPFACGLVVLMRDRGQLNLRIFRAHKPAESAVLPDALHSIALGTLPDYESTGVLLTYESFTHPRQVRWLDLRNGCQCVLKAYEVRGNFDSSRYLSKRLWATSPDGTRVPISITLRADHQHRGPLRLLLNGYGAYGITQEPEFSYSALSLLDRGFALATAHVRGGGILGQTWHAAGQGLDKQRSFDDFIACAQYLIDEGWTTAEALVIHGASAGGLLVGAVLNQRPELFRAAIARQPFVDVLTAMSDPNLALTTREYQEWGDPREAAQQAAMRRWSPYENVTNQAYPALLVSAGLLDRQVPYWQPAKWVARLRERKAGDYPLLLMTDLQGVHGAPFARDERIRRDAVEYAFMFKALGLAEHAPGD